MAEPSCQGSLNYNSSSNEIAHRHALFLLLLLRFMQVFYTCFEEVPCVHNQHHRYLKIPYKWRVLSLYQSYEGVKVLEVARYTLNRDFAFCNVFFVDYKDLCHFDPFLE